MDPIRVGIVGCGEVSQIVHLPTLAQLPEQFAITAVCDISPTVLQAVGERWGVANRFLDFHELCASPDVDAVLVANPNAYHAEVTLAALRAGKHVLVEKPMCMNLREADEIIAAQQQAGRVVQVGYMRRYAPAFTEAVRLLPQLGPIKLARVHDVIGANATIINATSRVVRGTDIPQAALSETAAIDNRLLQEAIGDASPELKAAYRLLLGLSVHDISAMRELLGLPRGVLFCAHRQGGRCITAAFDYGDFVCQFETAVDAIPRYDTILEVYTQDTVLRVEYAPPYVLNMPIQLRLLQSHNKSGYVESIQNPTWGDAFNVEWQAFYRCISEGGQPKTSPADFREDLTLFNQMVARMRSLEQGG